MGNNEARKDLNTLDSFDSINWKQTIIAIVLMAAMVFFGNYLKGMDGDQPLSLVTGLMFGYVLTRSRFGFAGGIKKIYLTGDGSLTKALLIMFGLSSIAVAGIHYAAVQEGATISRFAAEGQALIPGDGHIIITSLNTVLGGILFGIGMMLGGGCASGTFTDAGEGAARAWIVTIFFCIGGLIGHGLVPILDETFLGVGEVIYLPATFGYIGSVIITLVLLGLLYAYTVSYEKKRKREGTQVLEQYEGTEKPLAETREFKLFSPETYHKLFVERWSFMTGAVVLTVLFIFVLDTTGSSWGASGPFAIWGAGVLDKLGLTLKAPAFEGITETARNGILNHPMSVRNIGMVFGATIAMLLAGRFSFDFDFTGRDAFYYGLGGILMGVGAKIARGCNVGALYSGIANFSLSGWVFLVALIIGGVMGLKLFEGKVNIIPDRNAK